MSRLTVLLLGMALASPAWAQEQDPGWVPLDAAPPSGEEIRGVLAEVGPQLQPLFLNVDGRRLQLAGWPADLARLARMSRNLRDLVGRELVVEAQREQEAGHEVLRVVRLISPAPFAPRAATVADDGGHLTVGEADVPFDGPVGELLRQRAPGRVVQVAGLEFLAPDGSLAGLYLTRVQAFVGWQMALLRNAAGDAIGFVSPKTHVWLLGTSEDGLRAFTRDGNQLRLQFPQEPGLPWLGWLPERVDRYAPVGRFSIGEQPAPEAAPQRGLIQGLEPAAGD